MLGCRQLAEQTLGCGVARMTMRLIRWGSVAARCQAMLPPLQVRTCCDAAVSCSIAGASGPPVMSHKNALSVAKLSNEAFHVLQQLVHLIVLLALRKGVC